MAILSIFAEADTLNGDVAAKETYGATGGFVDGDGNTLGRGAFEGTAAVAAGTSYGMGSRVGVPTLFDGNEFWLRVATYAPNTVASGKVSIFFDDATTLMTVFNNPSVPNGLNVDVYGDITQQGSQFEAAGSIIDFKITIAPNADDINEDITVVYHVNQNPVYTKVTQVPVGTLSVKNISDIVFTSGDTAGAFHQFALLTVNETTFGMVVKTLDYTATGTLNEYTGLIADVNAATFDSGTYMTCEGAASQTFTHSGIGVATKNKYDVVGVLVAALGTTDDANLPNLQMTSHDGSTEYEIGSAGSAYGNNYVDNAFGWTENNPATAAPFTVDELNAFEFGFKSEA